MCTQNAQYKTSGALISTSNHCRVFFKTGVLKNVANFTGKTPVLESLFNKVADLRLLSLQMDVILSEIG